MPIRFTTPHMHQHLTYQNQYQNQISQQTQSIQKKKKNADDERIVNAVASLWSKNSCLPLLVQQEPKGIQVMKEPGKGDVLRRSKGWVLLSALVVAVGVSYFYFKRSK